MLLSSQIPAPFRKRTCIFGWIQKYTKKITAVKTQADVGSGEALRVQTRLRSNKDAQQRRLPVAAVRAPDFSRPERFSSKCREVSGG